MYHIHDGEKPGRDRLENLSCERGIFSGEFYDFYLNGEGGKLGETFLGDYENISRFVC